MGKRRLMLVAAALIGASAGSTDAQSAERFVLTGVVFVEGGTGRAWLQEPTLTHNEIVSLRPGDSIGPYRLTKVLEDRVEMEGPAGAFSVRLAGAPGPVTAAASATPAPPAPQFASAPDVPVGSAPDVPAPAAPVTAKAEVDRRAESSRKVEFDFQNLPSLLSTLPR